MSEEMKLVVVSLLADAENKLGVLGYSPLERRLYRTIAALCRRLIATDETAEQRLHAVKAIAVLNGMMDD